MFEPETDSEEVEKWIIQAFLQIDDEPLAWLLKKTTNNMLLILHVQTMFLFTISQSDGCILKTIILRNALNNLERHIAHDLS